MRLINSLTDGYVLKSPRIIEGEQGAVYGIKSIEELKQFAEINADKYDFIKKGIA